MKKLGFTLAEVLITLGIIGVVAALTAPALIQNASTAQIGPKLSKAVSTLELANENMLVDKEANTVRKAGALEGDSTNVGVNYIENLSNYMMWSYYDESNVETKYASMLKNYNGDSYGTGMKEPFTLLTSIAAVQTLAITKNGVIYGVAPVAGVAEGSEKLPAYKQLLGLVLIDINGTAEPNKIGRDAFFFTLYYDGSLKPIGGSSWMNYSDYDKQYNWSTGSKDKCNEKTVTSGWTCAGSIFENNLKVIYQ